MTDELGHQIRRYVDDMSSRVDLDTVMKPRRGRRARPLVLTGVLVLLLIVVAAIALATRRDPDRISVAGPSTVPLGGTTLAIPQFASPNRVLLAGTSLYGLRLSETRVALLARYDINERRIVAQRSLAGAGDMTLAPQGLFVVRSSETVPSSALVELLAADTLHTVRSFPVASPALRIAAVDDSIWVSSFVSVERFDAATGASLGKLNLDPEHLASKVWPRDLEVDPAQDRVVVAWTDSARNVGATEFGTDGKPLGERNAVAHSELPPPLAVRSIAVGDGTVFLLSQEAGGNAWRLLRSPDLSSVPDGVVRGSNDLRLRRAGDVVWAIDYNNSWIACIDRRTGRKVWTTAIDHPEEIAADDRELFVFTIAGIRYAPIPRACRDA